MKPSHSKHPSESSMHNWLSRSPTPQATPKPVKVSEPIVVRSIDTISSPRLGLGATVVRTPDEALRDTGVRVTYPGESNLTRSASDRKEKKADKPVKSKHKRGLSKKALLSPPTSPPLPPLPLPGDDEEKQLEGDAVIVTPRPARSLPPAPDLQRSPSKRSSMKLPKAISITQSSSSTEDPPSVPPLPPHVIAVTQPPSFSPVLVVEPSSVIANPDKVIITLETCTQTYRTTLSTLTSRPSNLSKYLLSLHRSSNAASSTSSVYSNESDDVTLYRNHLTSQGLLPVTSNIHIFLDRPSAPYAHILSYLRRPLIDGQPETLPYAMQLHNYTSSSTQSVFPSLLQYRLDMLIEVRDEAAYLNLEGLQKLCVDEIRNRYGPRQYHHQRNQSTSSVPSIHSLQASVYNLHPLQEKVETDLRDSISTALALPTQPVPAVPPVTVSSPLATLVAPPPSAIAVRRSKHAMGSTDNIISRSPPTPQSLDDHISEQARSSHSRSSSRSRLTNTPPAGWI